MLNPEIVELLETARKAILLKDKSLDDVLGYVPRGLTAEIYTENVLIGLNEFLDNIEEVPEGIDNATREEVNTARDRYSNGGGVDSIEIDEYAKISRGEKGSFIQGWLWLPKEWLDDHEPDLLPLEGPVENLTTTKPNDVLMEGHPFSSEELTVLFEVARNALADAGIFDEIADQMDMSDSSLCELRERLSNFMEKSGS